MLHVRFQRVRPDKVERLRAWMTELAGRADEVRETFAQEGVHAEKAWLIHTADGVVLAYALIVDDIDAAFAAHRASTLPIDHEHAAVMQEIDGGPLDVEQIWEMLAKE
ncbi:MAG: hypothetical protein DCC58_10830 [Chloroflexi bacterium]|nr:MAG: hypothetical protein DCC58_10830 [Chloroflexota bacterium]